MLRSKILKIKYLILRTKLLISLNTNMNEVKKVPSITNLATTTTATATATNTATTTTTTTNTNTTTTTTK